MLFNINEKVKVKLTPMGIKILQLQHQKLMTEFKLKRKFVPPKADPEGWTEWQLWVLMETFGPYTHIGMEGPFETTIQIPSREEKSK